MKKFLMLVACLCLAGNAFAYSGTGVFTMYDPSGGVAGIDSSIITTWDGGTNMTISFTRPFFGLLPTASVQSFFGEGTYTVDVNGDGSDAPPGYELVTFTVGPGQIGVNMDFGWGANTGIDVINVWNLGGTVEAPALFSTDVDGDGIPGLAMVDGPWPGFSANFDLTYVPEPASLLLIGSGLAGLFGISRRRK